MTPQIQVTLTELQYVAGTSDKFYRVFHVAGVGVIAQYGRNGTYGTFTYPDADKYKVINSKLAKGYSTTQIINWTFDHTPTEAELDAWANGTYNGTFTAPVVETDDDEILDLAMAADEATENGISEIEAEAQMEAAAFEVVAETTATVTYPKVMPMLAHNAEPAQLEFMLASPAWVTQPKVDGDRVMIEVTDQVKAFGRNGQAKVSNVSTALFVPFEAFIGQGRFVFDGEIVGKTLYLFDMPVAEGILNSKSTFAERYDVLKALVEVMDASNVDLVPVAVTEEDKRSMLLSAEADCKEGVMFRGLQSKYVVGRSLMLLKHKFVKTVDCEVIATGHADGKNSAILAVYDHDGNTVVIGKASTIGKNGNVGIKVGQVVEVKFLYIINQDAPKLYQPRIVKVRTDKAAAECSIDQLIGTATNKAVN